MVYNTSVDPIYKQTRGFIVLSLKMGGSADKIAIGNLYWINQNRPFGFWGK